ncbi:PIN domain-containing protein [Kribbella sp. CA-293567]|uniref:PIN domain-containing protein n=1 Tax=Kribbella sp. CA-293567 TaxID=3002436 RepID=UPI0022DE3E40|nr:PIN domain-containing protein [Kribbella sp. CA-293567]WBQ01828.1 PIN domain-containing protein [Kribbella sp. CA-293567]
MANPPVAFLDANVLRGQLTTDVMLSVADSKLFEPQWSAEVLDEVKRNRPAGVTAERADGRLAQMAKAFPEALITDYQHRMSDMRADEKDKHVLAAAVHGEADVLVTDNVKDFDPPATGSNAMPVERTSEFLGRLLAEEPQLVVDSMEKMVARNRRAPRTMPELIDKMVTQQDLKEFAHKLNGIVRPEQRGSHPDLQAVRAAKVALDGLSAPTRTAGETGVASEGRRGGGKGTEKSPGAEL